MTQVYTNPVDINVDTLLLPFGLDLGDGVISLFFLPVVTDRSRLETYEIAKTADLFNMMTRAFCKAKFRAIS